MKWKGLHLEKQSLFISMLYLLLSIVIMGLGINLVAHANLGTSALTSIPLVMNELVPLSFGELTMIFNIVLVISQVILLGKSFPLLQYFQLIVSFVLGVSVDFWGPMIQYLELNHFLWQLIAVVIGCFIIALSITIQLKADLVNNPGEGIVKVIALRFNTEFSKVKVPLDLAYVLIAVILSWFTLGRIVGVGIGTLVSAVLVGYFMRIIQKIKEF